jgi:ankyrin repeat protein
MRLKIGLRNSIWGHRISQTPSFSVDRAIRHGRGCSPSPSPLTAVVWKLLVAWVLLEHQSDVNPRDDDGQVPLHLWSRTENSQDEEDGSDIATLLLERGANVDK